MINHKVIKKKRKEFNVDKQNIIQNNLNLFLEDLIDDEKIKKKILNCKNQNKIKNILIGKSVKNKNKKPKPAFFYFCDYKRKEVSEKNPTLSYKQVTKILGNEWNSIKLNDPDTYSKYMNMVEDEEKKPSINKEISNKNK